MSTNLEKKTVQVQKWVFYTELNTVKLKDKLQRTEK